MERGFGRCSRSEYGARLYLNGGGHRLSRFRCRTLSRSDRRESPDHPGAGSQQHVSHCH